MRDGGRGAGAAQAGVVPAALGLAVLVYLLAYPPTLNTSDEALLLYGARRILDGQALYRDFFEFLTPASFYFFALVYAVAGVSVQAAHAAMAVVNAAGAVLVYHLARKLAGTLESVLAAVITTVLCFPAWQLASPHWLSTALCLATAAAVLAARGRPETRAAAAGALAGLTFCNQQQRGVFLGLWLVGALVLLATVEAPGRRWRRARRDLVRAATAATVVVTVCLGYAAWRASLAELTNAVVWFVLGNYRRSVAGRMRWGGNGWLIAAYTWPWLAHLVWPVLMTESARVAVRLKATWSREEAVRAALLLLAVLMTASVLYFPDAVHVAFVLPFTAIVVADLIGAARAAAGRHAVVRGALAATVAAALLGLLGKGWTTLQVYHRTYPDQYPTAFGTIAGTARMRASLEALRAAMQERPGERPTFFAYPGDASLYLTVPGDNPSRFSLMIPGYSDAEHYGTAIEALERRRVPWVVTSPIFLRKPNDPFLAYLAQRYEIRSRIGPGGVDYVLWARRPDA